MELDNDQSVGMPEASSYPLLNGNPSSRQVDSVSASVLRSRRQTRCRKAVKTLGIAWSPTGRSFHQQAHRQCQTALYDF